MGSSRGIAASGHAETSNAAAELLRAGGNAFDAALGALCAACVAEPLLVSPGGGGFLLAAGPRQAPVVYDFFCQTPRARRAADEVNFFPILADFGTDTQEFHIGMASIGVPGVVAGLFEAHRDLGRLPIREVFQPAVELARRGVRINALHHYVVRILDAILRSDPAAFRLFESPSRPGELVHDGDLHRNPDLAEAFEWLAEEGARLMYEGDWAARLAADSASRGGHLDLEDLRSYRVERRQPIGFRYRGAECLINPPPSPGGCLIAFALGLLEEWLPEDCERGDAGHAAALVRAMRAASLARGDFDLTAGLRRAVAERLLDGSTLDDWRRRVQLHSLFSRGTTHISVADRDGNLASLTASNGEGSAYVLPGAGFMLNNMLGEEDLNPGGFDRWRPATRLASMMSPALMKTGDRRMALGSGGSNRIRSAMTQVIVNVARFGVPLQDAVAAPRLHLEGQKLSIEAGWGERVVGDLGRWVPEVHEWPETNLFFGGVHAVQAGPGAHFEGAGDPRRGGAVAIA